MTDPRRIAHAINPRPFAHPANPDDPLGPSIVKEAEEERQELIRRAEGVLVELQAENARLRDALERIARENRNCASDSNSMALCILSTEAHARAALNEGGTDE